MNGSFIELQRRQEAPLPTVAFNAGNKAFCSTVESAPLDQETKDSVLRLLAAAVNPVPATSGGKYRGIPTSLGEYQSRLTEQMQNLDLLSSEAKALYRKALQAATTAATKEMSATQGAAR